MGGILEELFNRPAPLNPPKIEAASTDRPIDVTPPTTGEIRTAIRQIKCGNAAEPDSIPAEALKSDIEEEEQLPPTDWKKRYFAKIPKKRDLSKCENYTDITLLSVPGNVEADERFSRRPNFEATFREDIVHRPDRNTTEHC
ncbi:unnamed protein product [Schistosoma curassoni]|uniref:INCENP_ARK-bind domain-containing protein n=1 Tax=Schistosoma curassoni TaxID=6186 RepID=A0A183JYI4_9TREM|nr:unnamed protein product [Schistosoma curassoni]